MATDYNIEQVIRKGEILNIQSNGIELLMNFIRDGYKKYS